MNEMKWNGTECVRSWCSTARVVTRYSNLIFILSSGQTNRVKTPIYSSQIKSNQVKSNRVVQHPNLFATVDPDRKID